MPIRKRRSTQGHRVLKPPKLRRLCARGAGRGDGGEADVDQRPAPLALVCDDGRDQVHVVAGRGDQLTPATGKPLAWPSVAPQVRKDRRRNRWRPKTGPSLCAAPTRLGPWRRPADVPAIRITARQSQGCQECQSYSEEICSSLKSSARTSTLPRKPARSHKDNAVHLRSGQAFPAERMNSNPADLDSTLHQEEQACCCSIVFILVRAHLEPIDSIDDVDKSLSTTTKSSTPVATIFFRSLLSQAHVSSIRISFFDEPTLIASIVASTIESHLLILTFLDWAKANSHDPYALVAHFPIHAREAVRNLDVFIEIAQRLASDYIRANQ